MADAATSLPLAADTLSASLKPKPTSEPNTAPKTGTNTGSVSFAATPKPPSAPQLRPRPQRATLSSSNTSTDYLSDKATAAFVRRTLCPKIPSERTRTTPPPIHDVLPPLTSRNDVDLQVYALISVILREFVQNWYNKITPDETFVSEIVHTIAHCTRALEQRLRKVDLESLLFDQLPDLLDAHVRAYRMAKVSAVQAPIETDWKQIYHSIFPLPALSPIPGRRDSGSVKTQAENEMAYRQLLVQGVLTILLPTEDLENECLTALVGQIFSELIVGNLFISRLSQPWLIWEIFCLLTELRRPNSPPSNMRDGDSPSKRSTSPGFKRRGWSIQHMFWSLIQWGFLVVNLGRLTFSMLVSSSSLPPRPKPYTLLQDETSSHKAKSKSPRPSAISTPPYQTAIVDFRLWSCIGNLLDMDSRMPWLAGLLSILQWGATAGPGKVAGFDGAVDRLLWNQIHAHVLDPDLLPPLLRSIRAAVFPNNTLGSPSLVAPSSAEELKALRRRCANSLWSLVPKGVGRVYFGASLWPAGASSSSGSGNKFVRYGPPSSPPLGNEEGSNSSGGSKHDGNEGGGRFSSSSGDRQHAPPPESQGGTTATPGNNDDENDRIISEIESDILDIFSDEYCNKHLLYAALELILVRLMPELAERGIAELWEDRLS